MPRLKNTARKSTGLGFSRIPIHLNGKKVISRITPYARKSTSKQSNFTTAKRIENAKTAANVAKPSRYRPGVLSLREIRRYQKTTELLLRRAPFQRLVREIAHQFKDDFLFRVGALEALQVRYKSHCISFAKSSEKVDKLNM